MVLLLILDRSTSAVDADKIYVLRSDGDLACIDKDGQSCLAEELAR
jgi:hypothetical protein